MDVAEGQAGRTICYNPPMQANTLFWYDLETSGTDPIRDRIIQFAGVRTDFDLRLVANPVVHHCRCPDDILPDPDACLVTRWTPARTPEHALDESGLMAVIAREFFAPGTCVVGYNNIVFDDQFVRYGLFRNLYDTTEWQDRDGSLRWDLTDVIRAIAGLRPDGMRWPRHNSKTRQISFRLDDLARVNHVRRGQAHEALSDVMATLEIARLLRLVQPQLFDYLFAHRDASSVREILGPPLTTPALHVSSNYSAASLRMRPVTSVGTYPEDDARLIVVDLMASPEWLQATDQEFDTYFSLPRNHPNRKDFHVPLEDIRMECCPAVLPMTMLNQRVQREANISPEQVARNLLHYRVMGRAFVARALDIYLRQSEEAPGQDVEVLLDGGAVLSLADRKRWSALRALPSERLGEQAPPFDEQRLSTMLLRYRARNHPETLSPAERDLWTADVNERLYQDVNVAGNIGPYARQSIRRTKRLLGTRERSKDDIVLLQELLDHTEAIVNRYRLAGEEDAKLKEAGG